MKKKDLLNLKNKSAGELGDLARDLSLQIIRAKMELSLHKAKNTNIAKGLKKTLAQALTIKRAKELTVANK